MGVGIYQFVNEVLSLQGVVIMCLDEYMLSNFFFPFSIGRKVAHRNF